VLGHNITRAEALEAMEGLRGAPRHVTHLGRPLRRPRGGTWCDSDYPGRAAKGREKARMPYRGAWRSDRL